MGNEYKERPNKRKKLTYFTMHTRSTKYAWNSWKTLFSLSYDWKQVSVNEDDDLFNLPNSSLEILKKGY